MEDVVEGGMDTRFAGASCARCFEGLPDVASRRFAGRGDAFGGFTQLINIGFMPAMCELPAGGAQVCWAPCTRQEAGSETCVKELET